MTSSSQFFFFPAMAPALAVVTVMGISSSPAPAEEAAVAAPQEKKQKAVHWSLAPLSQVNPPAGSHPVDWFIQQGLAGKSLRQNESADGPTLMRRMSLDMIGLPPTRKELADFLQQYEASPEKALEQWMEHLLHSPHYGERWGRHWLDVARYVQGTIKVPGVKAIDMAEAYRDYVVKSFNEDKPYDRFLTEQLAGDLLAAAAPESLEEAGKKAYLEAITAPAFLSIGPWFDECTDPNRLRLDIIDEQISTLTKAFLALDFACARCHDHKTDPVPTRDYYALAGILRSTRIVEDFAEAWRDGRPRATRPLADRDTVAELQQHQNARQALLDERFQLLQKARDRILQAGASALPERPWPAETAVIAAGDFAGHKDLKTTEKNGVTLLESRRRLDQWVRYRFDAPEAGDHFALVRFAAPELSPVKLEVNGQLLSETERILDTATHGRTPEHFRWAAFALPDLKKGGNTFRLLVGRDEPFPLLEEFRIHPGADLPSAGEIVRHTWPPTPAECEALLTETEQEQLAAIDAKITEIEAAQPAPSLTLSVQDEVEPVNLPVHIGGDVYRKEEQEVPRGVPTLVDHVVPSGFSVPENESGRVQLAEWLTHPDHPLTARVMVNRIWQWHFGRGLVRTPDDFGKTGSTPTHPELLDWLAREFQQNGWSVKHLHRIILTSSTYRASSVPSAASKQQDPDGTLFSHFPARRLEVEAIYDSMTASTGKVARQAPRGELNTHLSKDRALYILTSARSPLGMGVEIRKMFPLFGFDASGRPIHQRDASSTPQQALWWLNNPLPRHFATQLAQQTLTAESTPEGRARHIHETILGLPLDQAAQQAILEYVEDGRQTSQLSEEEAWTRACLGLFSSHPFSHLE